MGDASTSCRSTMSKLHLFIVTEGDGARLSRTLCSLEAARLPTNLGFVSVLENGETPRCQAIASMSHLNFEVRYRYFPGCDKAQTMNLALEAIPDDAFVVFSSDEIRFHSDTLVAYELAAQAATRGEFFGGPFQCDYELQPPPWVIPYLPLASQGWQPAAEQIDSAQVRFFGFNWAAFCHDIKRLGGFGLRPQTDSTSSKKRHRGGIQRRMLASGMHGRYVPEAIVSRSIPRNQCTIDSTIGHAHQDGINRGRSRRDSAVTEIALHHWSNTVRLLASTALKWVTSPRWTHQLHFRASYRQQQAIGYFRGFRSDTDLSPLRRAS
jgi:hypothetical protein